MAKPVRVGGVAARPENRADAPRVKSIRLIAERLRCAPHEAARPAVWPCGRSAPEARGRRAPKSDFSLPLSVLRRSAPKQKKKMSEKTDSTAPALIPFALKDAPALIEAVFPAQKISAEAQKERKAVGGKP